MGGNVTKIIEGTFTVIIVAWVLTHATEFGAVAGSISDAFDKGVAVLEPK